MDWTAGSLADRGLSPDTALARGTCQQAPATPLRPRRRRKLLSVFCPVFSTMASPWKSRPPLPCAAAWGCVQEPAGQTPVRAARGHRPQARATSTLHQNLPARTWPAQPGKRAAKFPPGSQMQTPAAHRAGPPGGADWLQTRKQGTA